MPLPGSILRDDDISLAEAAALLHVSPSTVWRWGDSGRLPAYRVGPRRIRVKRADVDRCIEPAAPPSRPLRLLERVHVLRRGELPPPLTDEEMRRGLAAIEEGRRLAREFFGDQKLQPESWEIINEMRDQRTRRLMGDGEE